MKLDKALVEDVDVTIDMSPLIDMVFLLLIFFIVASTVVDLSKPSVDLVSATEAKAPEETKGRMQVSVNADEVIFIGPTPVSIEDLKEQVGKEMEVAPETRIFLRVDRTVPYVLTKKIMNTLSEVDALDLIFATFEE